MVTCPLSSKIYPQKKGHQMLPLSGNGSWPETAANAIFPLFFNLVKVKAKAKAKVKVKVKVKSRSGSGSGSRSKPSSRPRPRSS